MHIHVIIPNDFCTNYPLIPWLFFRVCVVVYPLVLQPSLVPSLLFTHSLSPHHLFLQPGKLGTLSFPSFQTSVSRMRGKPLLSCSSAVSLPSLSSCLARRGGKDVLGLDPGAEPARAGPAPRRVGGRRAHAPLPA